MRDSPERAAEKIIIADAVRAREAFVTVARGPFCLQKGVANCLLQGASAAGEVSSWVLVWYFVCRGFGFLRVVGLNLCGVLLVMWKMEDVIVNRSCWVYFRGSGC